ncbi:hypothetical protein CLIB1423_14S01024 [[Candida] railenensis]|uniref:Uncharacterized protein n=1 Tax=[Candida] railenensis TaxID=45579 RepID=A0A9P0QSD9_9ASCO|nr:hypothetical protein CLIB1423_14S01024 [[Candida] railenensis]
MRSLPHPRITKKRRWKRFKRALKALIFSGDVSDPGAFVWRRKKKPTTIATRRRLEFPSHGAIHSATVVRKIATRASMPILSRVRGKSSSLNMTVRF